MPSTRSQERDRNSEDGPDLFTKLCLKMFVSDVGDRPLRYFFPYHNFSPSITFVPDPPLPVGVPAKIRVTVHNFGTMDATGCLLEVTYNIFIGNNPEAMLPISSLTLPTIPADGQGHLFEVAWTPPDAGATDASVHARVFDFYSLQHFPSRCQEWNSYINPQAANKSLRLVKLGNLAVPIIQRFMAWNNAPHAVRVRALMMSITDRDRVEGGSQAIFPLPIRLERLPRYTLRQTEPILELPPVGDPRPHLAKGLRPRNQNGDGHRSATEWERIFGGRTMGPWPTEEVPQQYIHNRFGLVADVDPENDEQLGAAERRSLQEIVLEPDEKRVLPFVIPPEEFPPKGRRRAFQVHYQTNHDLPSIIHVFLYH
jgi:hypothetical protein